MEMVRSLPFERGEVVEMVQKEGRSARLRPFDESGVVRGADGVLHYSDLPSSVLNMLRVSVERDPSHVAVIELGGDRVDYEQLWDRSARVAGGLVAEGIKRGDRVAIQLGNGLNWVLAFFGTLMAGGVVVPVNTRFTKTEADYVVGDSGASYIFESGRDLPVGKPVVEEGLSPNDLAAIFYTSGTTGFPKGAMINHECLLTNCENARRVKGLEYGQVRNLVSVPLFHATGCNSQLLSTCELGGTTVIMPTFDVKSFFGAIADERINTLVSVPAIYWLVMNQPDFSSLDVSRIRWVSYGGAPISSNQVLRMKDAFPMALLGNGFGLTETTSISTYLPNEYSAQHPETVGFAAPPVELDLFEPDSKDGAGELLIRGPNVVSGYWKKPEATAETFTEGWLHSGDIARLDADGFCTIVDRKKDMVNRGGENVYCVEVENVLAGCPGVFEVAVVGVPDDVMGEKVGAIIVPVPGTDFDPAVLVAYAGDRLADFKVPQYVQVRSEVLPRNPGGKVLKNSLRDKTTWGSPIR
jgi:acyl-CoA synthetase (AMP-forming)/AMP-acid ligase II